MKSISQSGGFTMIESLVSMTIISLVFFSTVGFQFSLLNDNRNTMHRTMAVEMVNHYIARMRMNRGAAKAGMYNYSGQDPAAVDCETSEGCTPDQLVSYDQKEIKEMLDAKMAHGLIPEASLTATFNGNYYLVELSWKNFANHKFYNQDIVKVQAIFQP